MTGPEPPEAGLTAIAAAPGGPSSAADGSATVLDVRNLSVSYRSRADRFDVVNDVTFQLTRSRTLALVGESGSGKTTVARAVMGLVRGPFGSVGGSIRFGDQELVGIPARRAASIYGRDVSMIFQEPMRSLNPAYSVGDQIAEVARRHLGVSRRQAWDRAVEVMEQVRIPRAKQRAKSYPFEFSGGMCQRIMIAMALVCRPSVLIADEPTTALDVTVQAQVLDLLKEQQEELGLAMLFITHDLGVVADIADEMAVLYGGQIVEMGAVQSTFSVPRHPYTDGLLASIPSVQDDGDVLSFIPGRVPAANEWPDGCRFRDRCAYAIEACAAPIAIEVSDGRQVRCIRADELTFAGVARA